MPATLVSFNTYVLRAVWATAHLTGTCEGAQGSVRGSLCASGPESAVPLEPGPVPEPSETHGTASKALTLSPCSAYGPSVLALPPSWNCPPPATV